MRFRRAFSRICVGVLVCALVFVGVAGVARGQEAALAQPGGALRLGFVTDAQEEGERPLLRAAVGVLDDLGASWLLYGGDTSYDYNPPPWDWRDAMAPFENRTLYVYGSHDTREGYEEYQPRANVSAGAQASTWWVWGRDGVVVVGLDTNAPLWKWSEQGMWLDATLAEHANETVILLLHKPWWVPSEHAPQGWIQADATHMDALMERHEVDLVLSGHEHYYSRMTRNDTTYVIGGPVEAHTRDVPWSVALESDVSVSSETWMVLDVLPCGVLAEVYDVRAGHMLDSFSRGEGLRGGDGSASCPRAPPMSSGAVGKSPAGTTNGTSAGNGTGATKRVGGANGTGVTAGGGAGNASLGGSAGANPPAVSSEVAAGEDGVLVMSPDALLFLVAGPTLGVVTGVFVGYLAGLTVGRHEDRSLIRPAQRRPHPVREGP